MECFNKVIKKLLFILSIAYLTFSSTLSIYAQVDNNFPVGFNFNFSRSPFKSWIPKPQKVEPDKKIPKIDFKLPEKKIEIIPPILSIQGVVWNTENPQAIINDSVVSLGDKISGAHIVDISKEGVQILYQDTLFFVKTEDQNDDSKLKARRKKR